MLCHSRLLNNLYLCVVYILDKGTDYISEYIYIYIYITYIRFPSVDCREVPLTDCVIGKNLSPFGTHLDACQPLGGICVIVGGCWGSVMKISLRI